MADYIPGLVIQRNNQVYISSAGISAQYTGSGEVVTGLGLLTEIPTPDGGAVIDFDCWATPVGEGIVSGFTFTPYNANDPIGSVQPNVQAFKCFRIYNRFASDDWYVLGTVAEYITAFGGGAALPTTISTLLAGFQVLCQFVDAAQTKYGIVLALPPLIAPDDRYFPFGYFNGVELPAGANAGYATVAALLAFLNANWTNLGSPVTAIVWTASTDGITLVGLETAGGGTDIFAGMVVAINPSL
jgi:hypothetical protein